MSEYRISQTALNTQRQTAAIFAALGIISLVVAIIFASDALLILLLIVGTALLAWGIVNYRRWQQHSVNVIHLTDGALLYRSGNDLRFAWASAELTHLQTKSQRFWQLKEGENVLAFDQNWDEMGVLIGRIQTALLKTQLPTHRTALLRGETIRFGNYAIDQAGLYHNNLLTIWDDIAAIKLDNDQILLQQNNQWHPWATTVNFPNYFIFLRLLPVVGHALMGSDQ